MKCYRPVPPAAAAVATTTTFAAAAVAVAAAAYRVCGVGMMMFGCGAAASAVATTAPPLSGFSRGFKIRSPPVGFVCVGVDKKNRRRTLPKWIILE